MSAPPPGPDPLFQDVLALRPEAFALLHRPERAPGVVEVLAGRLSTPGTLAELPLSQGREDSGPGAEGAGPRHEVLTLIPHRQLVERGFTCADDGAPLLALSVTRQSAVPVHEALAALPEEPIRLSDGHFDIPDEDYADIVRRVVTDEIGTGEGANFVIKRSYLADITDYTPRAALVVFRRLLERESGAYWTFLVHTGERTFVGATPERHVSLDAGEAVMNPISGTYRYPAQGPSLSGVLAFLADRKETDELFMVVDEELKMMARVCEDGGRAVGPRLKEMARLAHTEYLITGRSDRDPPEILRQTLFAPTVTGSPLESACRVIDRYEPQGRGYYSGVVGLIGRDERGGHALDSAILIRTADIDAAGRTRIGVGATLVRDSDPVSEVAETAAKAEGLLAALRADGPVRFAAHPRVRETLERRNDALADFWLADRTPTGAPERAGAAFPELVGKRILLVDAEDTFTAMMDRQLRSLGLEVTVRRFDEAYAFAAHDLVLMGPGPGDPRDPADPRIAHIRQAVRTLLDQRRPFLAVCLSHQVLSLSLGLDLRRRDHPNQGVQRGIDLLGTPERVGFYNTYEARCQDDKFDSAGIGPVEVCREPVTDEVHALRGPFFASVQFHAESVLTRSGPRILGSFLRRLV